MVLKLHGFPLSTCTNRVRVVLEEKGVQVEFIPVDLLTGEQKSESYLNELHPFGKVPVFQDTETGVQIFGELYHYVIFDRALSVEQSYFDPIASQIAFEKVFKPRKGLGATDEARVQALLAQLDVTLQGYERILSKQPYLAGDKVTLADLYHLPYGAMAESLGAAELYDKYPATKKWWEGLKARESWKKVTSSSPV
ncbi:glutathione S-transferase [Penicillium malachiteum]|uniref:glutathione S-transferase n=1 Tax=Penicillium malachiteum TaxID=1324776 RepID=UPI002546E4C8|nr:glutathione S-transferase [Penicillium malachiteum]KAJ5726566.1 glutathione S-transferase [Penicillium malachiteum]